MIENSGTQAEDKQDKPKRVYVGGRPPKFKSVEEMQDAINAYFERTLGNVKVTTYPDGKVEETPAPLPVTMSGLANSLGMDRISLLNYEKREVKGEKKFFNTIREARRLVEEFAEGKLFQPGVANGAAFSLRNNAKGWEDRRKVDENSKREVSGHIVNEIVDYTDAQPQIPDSAKDKIQDL